MALSLSLIHISVSTLPTVSTSTRNEPRATSTGTASTVSVRLLTHKTRMIWRQPSQMWNVNSTKPTTRLLWKARTSATPRSGTRNATAPFPTCCTAARPARDVYKRQGLCRTLLFIRFSSSRASSASSTESTVCSAGASCSSAVSYTHLQFRRPECCSPSVWPCCQYRYHNVRCP